MGLLDIIPIVGGIIDKAIPDPQAKMDLQLKLAQLADGEASRAHDESMGQIDINKIEAANPNVFVAGWRPALGWGCVLGVLYSVILAPMFHLGMPDVSFLETILLGILGLGGGMRTLEKIKGVDTQGVVIKTPVVQEAAPVVVKKKKPLGGLWPF
jgi:hypothetical protein